LADTARHVIGWGFNDSGHGGLVGPLCPGPIRCPDAPYVCLVSAVPGAPVPTQGPGAPFHPQPSVGVVPETRSVLPLVGSEYRASVTCLGTWLLAGCPGALQHPVRPTLALGTPRVLASIAQNVTDGAGCYCVARHWVGVAYRPPLMGPADIARRIL
jgi:hypothetical protein